MSEEKKQRLKEYQKTKKNKKTKKQKNKNVRLKSLNLIINVFYGFDSVCYDLVMHY